LDFLLGVEPSFSFRGFPDVPTLICSVKFTLIERQPTIGTVHALGSVVRTHLEVLPALRRIACVAEESIVSRQADRESNDVLHFWLTSKMSHDGIWRAACLNRNWTMNLHFEVHAVARGVTDVGVGSGALLGGLGAFPGDTDLNRR
jgi:hypothetical protein